MSDYIASLVSNFTHRVEVLTEIAKSQPQAAFTAFIHGMAGEWTFLTRTMRNVADLLQPLEDTITPLEQKTDSSTDGSSSSW